jgi:hypothetical protein
VILFITNFMKGSLTDESTRLGLSEKAHNGFSSFQNQILKSETKELALLKHKCQSLNSAVAALKADNAELRREKEALLALNSEYIGNLNVPCQST